MPDTALAPIALFAYKRADHLRRTLEALAANPEAAASALHVFSDGPKSAADANAVAEVRQVLAAPSLRSRFGRVTVVERSANAGLAASIIEGVTQVLAAADTVIVMEDDLVVSPMFLAYMNRALSLYADEDRVISVHGYVYPVRAQLPETFFLRGADCWGWATWRRGWALFDPDGARLLKSLEDRALLHRFDFDGAFPYAQMLRDQIAGNNDSWAIRWHASAFLQDRLTLYPGRSLVDNIGNDASGTHSGHTGRFDVRLSDQPVRVDRIATEECEPARAAIREFLRPRAAGPTGWRGWLSRLRRALA